jgi:hypothetical protein
MNLIFVWGVSFGISDLILTILVASKGDKRKVAHRCFVWVTYLVLNLHCPLLSGLADIELII